MNKAILGLILLSVMPGFFAARGAQTSTFKEVCTTVTDIGVPQYPVSPASIDSDETVTVGIKVLQDGSVAAVALGGAPVLTEVAVDAAKRWRFAPLPKPENYPFRVKVSFSFRTNATELEIQNDGDVLLVIIPKGEATAGRMKIGEEVGGWLAVKREAAPYPPEARERHTEGTVIVGVDVDSNGRVTKAIAESGPMSLRSASALAARGWRFRPLKVNGQPISLRARLKFNFAID